MLIQNKKGFTLIEAILVMTILVVLAISVVPNTFNLLVSVDISSVKDKIQHDINYVQDYAITNHTNTWMEFDPVNNRYYLSAGENYSSRLPIYDFSEEYNGTVPISSLNEDVQITELNFGGGNILSFDWWGIPNTGGSIILNQQAQINVSRKTGYTN